MKQAYRHFSATLLGIFLSILPHLVNAKEQIKEKPASFIVIGDMPYRLPSDFERFERVIQTINHEKPDFAVHVGDIMNGGLPCTDDNYNTIADYFKRFTVPFIYTPGDNEWTDCHRLYRIPKDPIERLGRVRQIFFAPNTHYEKNLKLVRESENPAYKEFVENARWEDQGVVFATFHIVGSENQAPGKNGQAEFERRNAANLSWLREAFSTAEKQHAKAVVTMLQANPNFDRSQKDQAGFYEFNEALKKEVQHFQKPVLMVHGDSHRFWVDKPLLDAKGKLIWNFTRVCVFGDDQMHGVKFIFNPENPETIDIRPLKIPGND